MKPSIMCYVPPSVELLELTTLRFQTLIHDSQISNQIDASNLDRQSLVGLQQWHRQKMRWAQH